MTQAPVSPSPYWRRTRRLTLALLALWFVATFVTCFYARALNEHTFLGFPLGFYMSAQGVLLIYLAIVGFYAHRMDQLDEEATRTDVRE